MKIRTAPWLILALSSLAGCAAPAAGDAPEIAEDSLFKCTPLLCGGPIFFPPVETADVVFEVDTCLSDVIPGVDTDLANALRGQFTSMFPGAEVLAQCSSDRKHERIGVWTTPGNDADRTSELAERPSLLRGDEGFAALFTNDFVQKAKDAGWASAVKVMGPGNDNSYFSALVGWVNGVDLRTIDPVALTAPNQVTSSVHGYTQMVIAGVKTDWVPLDLRTTDTLGVKDGVPTCSPSTEAVVHFAVPISKDVAGGGASVGCPIVNGLPQSFPIPGGNEIVLTYTRNGVTADGMEMGGYHTIRGRAPSAWISGPSVLTVDAFGDRSVDAAYSVGTGHMRGPLTIAWSASSGAASPASGWATTVTFNLPASMPPLLSRSVTAQVTDADGLHATATFHVQLQRDACSTGNSHIAGCL